MRHHLWFEPTPVSRTPVQALREALGTEELLPMIPVAADSEEVKDADIVAA